MRKPLYIVLDSLEVKTMILCPARNMRAEILEDLGLLSSFEQVFTSALAGYEKPRVELFQLALLKMGEPECVWMIGDDPVSDVGGANSAGIPAILARREADVPFVASDLAAVIRIINDY